ncbi:MAG: DUF4168 domain-containing protein [Balneola sp.]
MKILKTVKALILTIIVCTTAIAAQQGMQMPQVAPADSVSDAELEQFVYLAMDIQGIRMELDSLVIDKLSDEGMSTQRFQEIMRAQQNPQSTEPDLSEKEIETMATMNTFLQDATMKAQQKQMATIQNAELSQERFQSIAMALQSDQALAMRFQEKAAEIEADN